MIPKQNYSAGISELPENITKLPELISNTSLLAKANTSLKNTTKNLLLNTLKKVHRKHFIKIYLSNFEYNAPEVLH